MPPQIDTPTLGEEKNDAVADSPDESATTPTRICEGKQLVRERMYAAAN